MIVNDMKALDCTAPATLADALVERAERPELLPLAGGTEVMVLLNAGLLKQRSVQSLHRLAPELRFVRATPEVGLSIGALATYTDVRHHPAVLAHWPLLAESARVTGALQIQNRGTLAGNIVNGSPAADTVPVLMAYNATVRLASNSGQRMVPLAAFYTGYRKTVLRADELLTEIIVPPQDVPLSGHYYRKVGTREAQAISKVVVAGVAHGTTVRLAWGSVAPTTLRTPRTEAVLAAGGSVAEAIEALAQEISPLDDIRSTAAYRLAVSKRLLADFAAKTLGRG